MTANGTEGGVDAASERPAKPRKPIRGGTGGGVWAGYAMALLLASRTIMSLARSLGPVAGGAVLAILLGGIPLILGVLSWRERREEQARVERWRARRRRGGRGDGVTR